MPSRTEVQRRTDARLRRLRLQLGDEIRSLRTDAGLSLREVAVVAGVDHAHIARIEIAQAAPSLEVLARVGAVLGADLSVRYFPSATPRLRDRFQAPMVEAFLRDLGPRWAGRVEVPVVGSTRGVIDVALDEQDGSLTIATEFQSEIRRLEAMLRRSTDKASALQDAEPGRNVSRLLVLRSTTHTREIARVFGHTLSSSFPAPTAGALRALTGDGPWAGPAIVWMSVRGNVATLMAGPPRGVSVGR